MCTSSYMCRLSHFIVFIHVGLRTTLIALIHPAEGLSNHDQTQLLVHQNCSLYVMYIAIYLQLCQLYIAHTKQLATVAAYNAYSHVVMCSNIYKASAACKFLLCSPTCHQHYDKVYNLLQHPCMHGATLQALIQCCKLCHDWFHGWC